MDFKKLDRHTPEYYFKQYREGFSSKNPQVRFATLFGLLSAFSQDFDMLAQGALAQDHYHVVGVVDYLDRKYTATISYFHANGYCQEIPVTGYKESLLGSREDIARVYMSKSGIII